MIFNRRDVLKAGAALSLTAGFPRYGSAQGAFAPRPDAWREFEITTRLEIANAKGKTQAWIPVPSVNEANWFKSSPSKWTSNGKADLKRDPSYGADMLHVEWADISTPPVVEVTSVIRTRDRAVDLSKSSSAQPLSAAEQKLYLGSTDLIPTGGIVKDTADKIVAGKTTDLDKAKAIYEWVVENTFRDAKVRGCGIGDIAAMLKSGNLGGKCADINALYVGLARASGLPARDVYGIPRGAFKIWLQEPRRRLGGDLQGAALPCRSSSGRRRLGACRSCGRPRRSRSKSPGQSRDRRSESGCRTRSSVRFVGNQLARLQFRP